MEVVWRWGPGASEALQATERYIDLEGGIRAQKTTALCAWIAIGAVEHPGSNSFLCRYTDHDLSAILKPKWREYCAASHITVNWNAQEECDEIRVGATISRVYLKGLKSSDETQRFSKLRGPTLSRFGIDQAEELPPDYWPEIQGRVSQPGFPQQIMLTPQPVNPDHWIAKEFPEDNRRPGFKYIRTNCYDNRVNLGDAYIEELERIYLEGTADRRTLLEGRRGLASKGIPVYKDSFRRGAHVNNALRMNPQVPLVECWDYGHSHPCVVWLQLFAGQLLILGGVMGEDMSIDQFAPIALEARAQWFPNPMEILTTGDPAGLAQSSQGLPETLKDILATLGIYITCVDGANRVEVRDQAIKVIARYMSATSMGRPGFQVNEQRFTVVSKDSSGNPSISFRPVLADGFEAGYVWGKSATSGPNVNIRQPKKDGYYDHSQNCVEYGVIAYGPMGMTQKDEARLERLAVKRAQRDEDPADRLMRSTRVAVRRGGY